MDKNTIIAFVLIGLILLLWPVFQTKIIGIPEPRHAKEQISEETHSDKSVQKQVTDSAIQMAEKTGRYEPIKKTNRENKRQTLSSDTIVIQNNLFRGELSTLGGGTVVSWKLKEYFTPEADENQKKNWVELIPQNVQGNLGVVIDPLKARGTDLDDIIFQYEIDTTGVIKIYRFFHILSNGDRIEKEFSITEDSYDVDLKIQLNLTNYNDLAEGYQIRWMSGLSPTEKQLMDDLPYYEAYALQGGEILKTKDKDTGIREGTTKWVAVRTKYFLMALIPQEELGKAAELAGENIEGSKWKYFNLNLFMPSSANFESIQHFKLYFGPMDYIIMKQYGVQLGKMMNFGMVIIRPFSIFFFHTLQFLYRLFHNYGWAIIVFSILIKIVLYPLTRKSFQSMKKMQELQPKMEALKEKYKNDPQRLNQETMKMYKQQGVNPLGGCLPMLLQMPVLFALFNLFRTTIMLRQAEFLLIKDLSSPDAILPGGFNLLPILMGASMIVQQKLSSTQNSQQKAMAYLMPIFLTFIFFRLSAGLNLYYLMFNLLTIVQEVLVKKHK